MLTMAITGRRVNRAHGANAMSYFGFLGPPSAVAVFDPQEGFRVLP
jgi:hypothetical protein